MNANFATKRIEMTKTEAKAAGKIGTKDYTNLLELMRNFPDYQIEIVKTAAKRVDHYKGLNYDYMENYIKNHDESKLVTFYELRGLDKEGKKTEMAATATYGEIKMWFLTQFPEIEKMGENVRKVLEETRKTREATKAVA